MRQIIESEESSTCVERLGGYRLIDEGMDPLIDALTRNPYGFHYIQNDFVSFRYATTRSIGGKIPALVVVFTIDQSKNVILE